MAAFADRVYRRIGIGCKNSPRVGAVGARKENALEALHYYAVRKRVAAAAATSRRNENLREAAYKETTLL